VSADPSVIRAPTELVIRERFQAILVRADDVIQ